jgi:hypothetical protein
MCFRHKEGEAMTEKKVLTTKDCNCFTCLKFEPCSIRDERNYCNAINHEELTTDDVCLIVKLGCLSHPLALQVLAQPVTEQITNENKRWLDNHGSYFQGMREAYEDILKQLKGEKP